MTSKKIKSRTIATAALSAATIRRLMVTPAGSVRGDPVVDGSLGGADLAAGSVGGDRLAPGSVAGDRLAANAVASGQIVDQAILAGRLSDLDFGTVDAGACKAVTSTSLTPVAGNQDVRDDAIVTAQPAGAAQIAVTVCNVGAAAMNLGTESFNYVTFDATGWFGRLADHPRRRAQGFQAAGR